MPFRPDTNDRDILQHLRTEQGATVQDVCAATGVTATAARYRLSRLLDSGLIARETVRAGRGRPHHVYNVTEAGHRELGENYAELALVLWQAVRDIDAPDVRNRVLARVRESMVDRYGGPSRADSTLPLGPRFDRLAKRLGEHGFDVETDTTGDLPILRERNCPYHELAAEDDGICELEQAVFAEVLGTAVVRSQCCLDGDACCEFTPKTVED
jgi:predicted ArsR family transcriptional regulator